MSEWFNEKKRDDPARLTTSHLSPLQRSIVCSMANGSLLRRAQVGYRLDTGFEAGCPGRTFAALVGKKLVKYSGVRGVWTLSDKGHRWAKLPWDNR